jgi:hypothetical protein
VTCKLSFQRIDLHVCKAATSNSNTCCSQCANTSSIVKQLVDDYAALKLKINELETQLTCSNKTAAQLASHPESNFLKKAEPINLKSIELPFALNNSPNVLEQAKVLNSFRMMRD